MAADSRRGQGEEGYGGNFSGELGPQANTMTTFTKRKIALHKYSGIIPSRTA